jgi:hypothetical protein
VIPNGGADTKQLDASSPPVLNSGIGLTVAPIDPDATSITGTGGTPAVSTAQIDGMPGSNSGRPSAWQPDSGTLSGSRIAGGGDHVEVRRPW